MNFEQYVPEAKRFLIEVAQELRNPSDEDGAYRILRNVMHTVREILSPEESMHLISQLPLILKGVYIDGWKMHNKNRIRSKREFLEALRSTSDLPGRDFGNDQEAIRKVQCVLHVLQNHVSTGEITHILDQFPAELLDLWRLSADENA